MRKSSLSLAALCLCLIPFVSSAQKNPLRVAVFADAGSGRSGITNVTEQLKRSGMEVAHLTGKEIATGGLSGFDAVVFTGGSGSKQAASLGDAGRENVRQFVRNGGGYLGICAGAYLACNGFSWGVGVLDAKTVDSRWKRGEGTVRMELKPVGKEVSGLAAGAHEVRYANGPILMPNNTPDTADYETLAFFRSELAKNGTPEGIMLNSPAIARGTFGKGRVVVSSPHPESTPGLSDGFVSSAVQWATGKVKKSRTKPFFLSTRR